MYCTVFQEPPSSGLSDDASAAYHRFRREAGTLGTIPSSFGALARSTASAYLAALTKPAPEAWTTLVSRTALLVQRAKALHGIVVFDAKEREALDFFEAIVRENADLLVAGTTTAASPNSAPLRYVSA